MGKDSVSRQCFQKCWAAIISLELMEGPSPESVSIPLLVYSVSSHCADLDPYSTEMPQNMSTALTTFVPILIGTNYQAWSAKMRAYLSSVDLWLIVSATTVICSNEAQREAYQKCILVYCYCTTVRGELSDIPARSAGPYIHVGQT
jgi:hypothetical protein